MKKYDLENSIISCIIQRPRLIEELYVAETVFINQLNKTILRFLKSEYEKYKSLDLTIMVNDLPKERQNMFIEYYTAIALLEPSPSQFYEYQEKLVHNYRNLKIKSQVKKFTDDEIDLETLIEKINEINNELLIEKKGNKVTPEEMKEMIRNQDKLVLFDRLRTINEKIRIKLNTVNVIGARPSEGKSALALNLFCDLAKTYNCIYFNMEMTETEIYERMVGIEANMPIADVIKPKTDYQSQNVDRSLNRIYTLNYEVVNGSKTINAIKSKIIKEQRNGHLIVFVDYIGYIVGKKSQNDRERIGEAVRELNNITKDYDCTMFIIAQINRNGSDVPTMQDLKDSGELEQTADTIILIHDENKESNDDVKTISLVIPKCRGGKRNIKLNANFDKTKQRITI